MVRAIVRKEGDRVLFEVSPEDPEIKALQEGQELQLTIGTATRRELSDAEFEAMIDRLIDENREALEYLAQ